MILTGNADTTRAIPGQRYGVATHHSTIIPAPPPSCPCPCHLVERPPGANVYCPECGRIGVSSIAEGETAQRFTHDEALTAPRADRSKWMTVGPPDYYFITEGNTLEDDLKKHYKTEEGANRAATELNLRDAIADRGLDAVQEKRARAFGKLSGRSWWQEDEFWWVREHGRYAVRSDSGWDTHADLAAVQEAIRTGDVDKVIDLDTGGEVPFTRTVTVELTA